MFAHVIFEHRNRIKRNDESIGTQSNTQKRNQSRRGNLRSMYHLELSKLSTSLITSDDIDYLCDENKTQNVEFPTSTFG